jgi:hypothetical protein
MTQKDNDKKETYQALTGEQNVPVEVVATDEEAVAVPVADSVPIPSKATSEQARPTPQSASTNTVQDSGKSKSGKTIPPHRQGPVSQLFLFDSTLGFDCLLCGDVAVRHIKPGSNVFLSMCGDIYVDMRNSAEYPSGSTSNCMF